MKAIETVDFTPTSGSEAPRKLEGFPPPLVTRILQADSILRAPTPSINTERENEKFRSVINLARRWRPGDVVTVAFDGGSQATRDSIVSAVQDWDSIASLSFDFWADPQRRTYREWSRQDQRYAAHIRIAFQNSGYWSFLGSESIDRRYARPNEASMNLEGFDSILPWHWRATVLHEFGHAIALDHEHQHPRATCEQEFRWQDDPGYVRTTGRYGEFIADPQGRRPGLYTVLGGLPNKWAPPTVDFNLRRLPFGIEREANEFDPASIMKYYFEPWMFVSGQQSRCFAAEATALSRGDRAIVRRQYSGPGGPPRNFDAELTSEIQHLELPQGENAALLGTLRTLAAEQSRTNATIRK